MAFYPLQQLRWLRFLLTWRVPTRPRLAVAPAVREARAPMPEMIREVEIKHQQIPRFLRMGPRWEE